MAHDGYTGDHYVQVRPMRGSRLAGDLGAPAAATSLGSSIIFVASRCEVRVARSFRVSRCIIPGSGGEGLAGGKERGCTAGVEGGGQAHPRLAGHDRDACTPAV